MDRRSFLRISGKTALAAAVSGCAPVMSAQYRPRRPMVNLHPVEVSWERVIRTTTGLRPNRASGFVLKPERLDAKTVIHNFGHGGAGWSLSWGTALMAAEIATEHLSRSAAVLGCGIVGLTTARQLQRRGFDVTIYAETLPPYTTSNMSWAGFTPNSGLVTRRTPEFDAQFRRAVQIAYREHQLLAGRGYGVRWLDSYTPTDYPNQRPGGGGGGNGGGNGNEVAPLEPLMPDDAETDSVLLGPGEHPFPTRYARWGTTMMFEPSIYLDMLMKDVIAFGGEIRVRRFDSPRDLMSLPEEVIVNCTGLGAKALFGDEELTPVKGQLVVLVPQPEVNYSTAGMMPRSDGIVLGHVNIREEWSLEVDQEARTRVMENAMRAFSGMRDSRRQPAGPAVRPRLAMGPPPVGSFMGLQS